MLPIVCSDSAFCRGTPHLPHRLLPRMRYENTAEDYLLKPRDPPQKPPNSNKYVINRVLIRKEWNGIGVVFYVDCMEKMKYFESFSETALEMEIHDHTPPEDSDDWEKPIHTAVYLFSRDNIPKLFEETTTIETFQMHDTYPLYWEDDNAIIIRRMFDGVKVEAMSIALNENTLKNIPSIKDFVVEKRCTKLQFMLNDTRYCDMLKDLRKESFAEELLAIGVTEVSFSFDHGYLTGKYLREDFPPDWPYAVPPPVIALEWELIKNYVSAGLLTIFVILRDEVMDKEKYRSFIKWLSKTGKDVNITVVARSERIIPREYFVSEPDHKRGVKYRADYELKGIWGERGELQITKVYPKEKP